MRSWSFFLCAVSAFVAAPGLAQSGDYANALSFVALVERYCAPSMNANAREETLETDGWTRVAKPPRDPAIPSDIRDQMDGFRTFTHEAFSQLVIFTTSSTQPDRVRDCIVDDPEMDPRVLLAVALDRFGLPESREEGPGYRQWPDAFGEGRLLVVGPSSIAGHKHGDAAMMLLVRHSAPENK